jgi:hypothetical protein
MAYASGETPKLRDRISNEDGRVGTVLDIVISNGGAIAEIIVRWDDGVADLRYAHAGNFKLISRAPRLYVFNRDATKKYGL